MEKLDKKEFHKYLGYATHMETNKTEVIPCQAKNETEAEAMIMAAITCLIPFDAKYYFLEVVYDGEIEDE